jgi:hypothetical protein
LEQLSNLLHALELERGRGGGGLGAGELGALDGKARALIRAREGHREEHGNSQGSTDHAHAVRHQLRAKQSGPNVNTRARMHTDSNSRTRHKKRAQRPGEARPPRRTRSRRFTRPRKRRHCDRLVSAGAFAAAPAGVRNTKRAAQHCCWLRPAGQSGWTFARS